MEIIVISTETVFGIGVPIYHGIQGNVFLNSLKGADLDKKNQIAIKDLRSLKRVGLKFQKGSLKYFFKPICFSVKSNKKLFKGDDWPYYFIRSSRVGPFRRAISEFGPLFLSSLNESGQKPILTLEEVKSFPYPKNSKVYFFTGIKPSGTPSSIFHKGRWIRKSFK